MSRSPLQSCCNEWTELEAEYIQLEEKHQNYLGKLDEMLKAQKETIAAIAHHRYRIKKLQDVMKNNIGLVMLGEMLKQLKAQKETIAAIAHHRYRIKKLQDIMKKSEKTATPEEKVETTAIKGQIMTCKQSFREMEESLPHRNGLYLSVILGQVSVSLLNKADKFEYKQSYEQFKLVVTYIVMVFSVILLFIDCYRWMDSVLHFLLVWYYCTLTIREHILIVNGSRIKGWWLTHHFLSTFLAGVILIWPHSETYELFRTQFLYYCLYSSCIQVMQYYYQRGSLYRLRALGERHKMDITVEGFMSWMWKGLTFLLPILFSGYFFQLHNAYKLYRLSRMDICHEWQVSVLSAMFLFSCRNVFSTVAVIPQKMHHRFTIKIIDLPNFNFWVSVLSAMFLLFSCGNVFTTLAVIRQKVRKEGLASITNKYRFRRNSREKDKDS